MAVQPPAQNQSPSASDTVGDAFAFLRPGIQFSDDDKRKLDNREVVVRILPADGHELAAMAAASLDAGPDAVVRSIRNIAALEKSSLIPQLGRFSRQPRLEDLQTLTLEEVDIKEIKDCQPDHCGLKLQPDEIRRLQRAATGNATDSAGRHQLEQEFRRILLERAQRYLREGDENAAPEFSTLLQHSSYVQAHMPSLVIYLERYPAVRLPDAESFLYWSKAMYAWKPMITMTHVTIVRSHGTNGVPEVLVVSREILSTRYTSASLALTALVHAPDRPRGYYLVHVNRTWVDGVHALWRPLVEHHVKKQARTVFADVRSRIERHAA